MFDEELDRAPSCTAQNTFCSYLAHYFCGGELELPVVASQRMRPSVSLSLLSTSYGLLLSDRASSVLVLIGINRRVLEFRFGRVSRWCMSVTAAEGWESRGLAPTDEQVQRKALSALLARVCASYKYAFIYKKTEDVYVDFGCVRRDTSIERVPWGVYALTNSRGNSYRNKCCCRKNPCVPLLVYFS